MSDTKIGEHTYSFAVSGATLYEVEQAVIEECNRYFGDLDYIIDHVYVEPKSYRYEHGSKKEPVSPFEAEVAARVPGNLYRQWRKGSPSWEDEERAKFAGGVRRSRGRGGGRTVE